MKKLLLLSVFIFLNCLPSQAQKIDQYTASNGLTYKKGDTVKLGRGSAPDGSFIYLQSGNWPKPGIKDRHPLTAANAGINAKVKAINQFKGKIYFRVGTGTLVDYILYIEDAIAVCEITPCDKKESDEQ